MRTQLKWRWQRKFCPVTISDRNDAIAQFIARRMQGRRVLRPRNDMVSHRKGVRCDILRGTRSVQKGARTGLGMDMRRCYVRIG